VRFLLKAGSTPAAQNRHRSRAIHQGGQLRGCLSGGR
jgi:hypothetical protein